MESKGELVPHTDPALVAAELPRDLAVIKMENDSIMSMAAAHPRDHAVMLRDLKTQLQTYKSFAKEATYSKPCGKGEGGGQRFARGLSIRAAEAIAEVYGYNRCSVEVTPIDGTTARVEASFVDYQRGRIWRLSSVISKVFKRRNDSQGRPTGRHNDDRFYGVVCKAEGSKLLRECITRAVPPGLRSELMLCVDEQLADFLDEKTVLNIVAQFSGKGVSKEDLEALIGKRIESFTQGDRVTLMELWRGVESGDVEVAELLAETNDKGDDKPTTSRAEQLADKLGAKKAPAKKDKPETPSAPEQEPEPQPDEQIGDGELYQKINRAYMAIPEPKRAGVRKQLGIGQFITACKKMTPTDANDTLIVLQEAGGSDDGK